MKRDKKVHGVTDMHGVTHLDRTSFFPGQCEKCSVKSPDLRPYGADGEWICFDCAKLDPQTTEKRMDQVLFGKKP